MMNELNQKQFAEAQGWSRSYVTELKQAGRLVITANGKVNVEASLLLIKQSEDPNRDDVRNRHAGNRGQGAGSEKPAAAEKPKKEKDPNQVTFAEARARKEHFLAEQAQLDFEKSSGKLVEMEAVRNAGADIGAQLRATLENLPDQLSPELAPITDPDQMHAVLVEKFQDVLTGLSARIAQSIAKTAEGA
jgi:hypothetical protein